MEERAALIQKDPAYGQIVCRCEEVSYGEIRDAIHGILGAKTLDGVKRRTRAGMGRCQAGFCSPRVMDLLSQELGLDLTGIRKSGKEAQIVLEKDPVGRCEPMKHEIVIIGGGPAGLAAAISARESGVEDVLIIEREPELGGILNQCIHNGFGLHTFKEELTGPEYAARFIEKAEEMAIPHWVSTTVVDLARQGDSLFVTCVSRERGLQVVEAGAVVLAMGCRERPGAR